MTFITKLKQLVKHDSDIAFDFIRVINDKDPNHVKRKQQQRAISDEAILVCLKHGVKKRTFGDLSFTLTDRSLADTKYSKYVDKLRGLTVIGNWERSTFFLITTFWNFNIKSHKRF